MRIYFKSHRVTDFTGIFWSIICVALPSPALVCGDYQNLEHLGFITVSYVTIDKTR